MEETMNDFFDQAQRVIGRAFFPAPPQRPQPVTVNVPPSPDYTLPILAIGGLAILMMSKKK